MSRSKRDIFDTEMMLVRLASLLCDYRKPDPGPWQCRAEALRRISMTLRTWHELECNGTIQRDEKTGKPQLVIQHGGASGTWRFDHNDYEAGALKRLKKIMARYPALTAYVQTDPRGCALYILKPGDVPEGERADAYYSRGLAVSR